MHQHNPDLIMALAEGSLGPDAAAAAEAEIAACARCSEDMALQVIALEALREAPAAVVNEFESARISRNLKRELKLAPHTTVQPATRRRRFIPIAMLGSAAAILIAVVFAAAVLQDFGGGDSEATATTAPATTTAAPAATSAPAEPEPTVHAAGEERADATTTTSAPTTAATTVPAAERYLLAEVSASEDLGVLRNVVVEQAGTASSSQLSGWSQLGGLEFSVEAIELSCGQEGTALYVTDAINFFTIARGEIDDIDVIVIAYVRDPLEVTEIIAHDATTCEIVAQVP